MPEETVICIDNSEYMRNGDYAPSRMDSQQEAANVICGAKTSQNAENTLAIVSMAARCPRVEVSLTNDLGKLLATLSAVPISGTSNFTTSIRVSQLALRRRSSDQATATKRIIAFVGSPLRETADELVSLATELLKFNISVDIVNFGEEVVNTEKLDAFISKLNETEQNSRLVTIPPGPHILSDMILKSPIVLGNAGAAAAAQGAASNDPMAGIDPNMDPELALAIRLSLEEDQRRREREAAQQPAATQAPAAANNNAAPAPTTAPQQSGGDDDIYMDDDAALQAALQMSMQQSDSTPAAPAAQQPAQPAASSNNDAMEETDDDLAAALALSAQQPQGEQKDEDIKDILQDEAFLDKVIGNLGNKKDDKKDDKK